MHMISNTSFFLLGVFLFCKSHSALLPQVVFPTVRQATLLALLNVDIVVGLPPSLKTLIFSKENANALDQMQKSHNEVATAAVDQYQ